jgi:hypothetical protein
MATLAEKLAAAEDAYHALMIGQSAVIVVDSNGERVEYNRANASKLAAYIEELKRQIAAGSTPRRSGPAGAIF